MNVSRRALLPVLASLGVLASPAFAQDSVKDSVKDRIKVEDRIKVLATFSILGDLVRHVGGDRVAVQTLVGPNGDAHVFTPSPADAKKVAEAKVIIVNGLGLEGWLDRLVRASASRAPEVVASKGVKPIKGEGDEAGKYDPHAWQDVGNAKLYVGTIRDGLIAADPAGKATYEANATAYLSTLDVLDGQVRSAIAAIPASNRRIVTTHDAFGYFGKAYGMQFLAPQGVSTESEASAKDVAKIIRQLKADKIPAVFLENVSDERLLRRIADESGAKIGGKLYSDALAEVGGPASTYVDMMHNNIDAFSAALAR